MTTPERFDESDVDPNEPDDPGREELAAPHELRERSHALRVAGEGLLREADGIDAAADEIEEGEEPEGDE